MFGVTHHPVPSEGFRVPSLPCTLIANSPLCSLAPRGPQSCPLTFCLEAALEFQHPSAAGIYLPPHPIRMPDVTVLLLSPGANPETAGRRIRDPYTRAPYPCTHGAAVDVSG